MIDKTNLRIAAPNQPRLVVDVHVLGVEEITGQRRESLAVRSQHTPGLPAHKFKLSFSHIDPIDAQPQTVAVTADGGVTRQDAEEIGFKIADHFRVFYLRIHTEPY